jgi:hypothetical protein
MKHITKIIFYFLLIALGIFFFIFGEIDDSPGAMLIGVLVVAFAILGLWRTRGNK